MKNSVFDRRAQRVRFKIKKSIGDKLRLSVFRSINYIYVQAIDDSKGVTVAHASSIEKNFPKELGSGRVDGAAWVGSEIAKRLIALGVDKVVFDRGGFNYSVGRIKALADSARSAGLKF